MAWSTNQSWHDVNHKCHNKERWKEERQWDCLVAGVIIIVLVRVSPDLSGYNEPFFFNREKFANAKEKQGRRKQIFFHVKRKTLKFTIY